MTPEKYITAGGSPVEDGFEYNSGTNKEWMSMEKIKEALNRMKGK